MLGSNFIELQAFELSLEGARRAGGTIFLPVNVQRWRTTRSWLAALDEEQKFDLDLVLDHLDLAKLGSALGEESLGSGILDGKLAAFGLLPALQVTTTWRLENTGTKSNQNAIDFSGRLEGGWLEASARAKFGVSDPVSAQAWLPLQLDKKQMEAGNWLHPAGSLFARVDCPALFLEMLPDDWRPGNSRGLVTGNISWNGKSSALAISGEADILDAAFQPPPPWPEVTNLRAHLRLTESAAVIDPLKCEVDAIPLDLRGRLSASLTGFGLTLVPAASEIELLQQPPEGARLSGVRMLGEGRSEGRPRLREALVRGTLWPAALSLTITEEAGRDDSSVSQTTYLSETANPSAGPLLLRIIPPDDGAEISLGDERVPAR